MLCTTKDCVDIYSEASLKVAKMIVDLEILKDRFGYIADARNEETDPKYSAEDALIHLGTTLANITIYLDGYKKEYQKEINNKSTENN